MQFGIFWTVGEICSATSRLIIEESVADKFYSKLKQMTETIVVGNPLDKDTRLGPVVNESQYKKVLGYIEVGSIHYVLPSLSIGMQLLRLPFKLLQGFIASDFSS